jgi:hypothetical protein
VLPPDNGDWPQKHVGGKIIYFYYMLYALYVQNFGFNNKNENIILHRIRNKLYQKRLYSFGLNKSGELLE